MEKNYGNTKCILPINWNQNPSPFNDCIIAVKGGDAYYVGCGAIQVAQIMAFHKYAKTTISPNINTIKNKWSLAKNWDGKYDFDISSDTVYVVHRELYNKYNKGAGVLFYIRRRCLYFL